MLEFIPVLNFLLNLPLYSFPFLLEAHLLNLILTTLPNFPLPSESKMAARPFVVKYTVFACT